MKIIILHGDNTLESYNRLQKFIGSAKSRSWEILTIKAGTAKLSEAIVSQSLFKSSRLVVIENANKAAKQDLKWLKDNFKKYEENLVFYHEGALPKTFFNSLPKEIKVEEFKLPKLIWAFLDSFFPGNGRNSLLLLHEIVKKDPVEFVFSLLAKLLRDLYWMKKEPSGLPYPSWRLGKLKNQATKFREDQLKEIISEFAEVDVKSKTSQANLTDQLDFIIAGKLD